MKRHSMNFFLKWSYLYAPTRYRILETQLQTFQYWDNSLPTWSLKDLNTYIVTNANDCPNLLSYGATFRMGVLLPNYPENIVKGENVPNFKVNTGTSESTSNVFQILQDLWLKQYQHQCNSNTVPNTSKMFHTMNTAQMTQPVASFRTTTPSAPDMTDTTTKQVHPMHVHQDTSCKAPLAHCTCPQVNNSGVQTR